MAQHKTPAQHHTTAQVLIEAAGEQRRQGYGELAVNTVQQAQVHALLAIAGQMLDNTIPVMHPVMHLTGLGPEVTQ